MSEWYVYILQSERDGLFYRGQTNNLSRRFTEHNNREENFTRARSPWRLVWYTRKATKSEAMKLERKLKNITSRQKLIGFISRHEVKECGPDVPALQEIWMQTKDR